MNDAIHIQDLRVWAHVGVLERERLEGQWFSLDLTLLVDCQAAARSDALSDTADYSLAVQAVQASADSADPELSSAGESGPAAMFARFFGFRKRGSGHHMTSVAP